MTNLINEIKHLIKGFILQEEARKQGNWYDNYTQGDYANCYKQKEEISNKYSLDQRIDKYLADCRADERLRKTIDQDVKPELVKLFKEYEKQLNVKVKI